MEWNSCEHETGERIMPSYGPELIQTMRAVLDAVMTKIPVDQVTPAVKTHMAEVILKSAAEGQTSYERRLALCLSRAPSIVTGGARATLASRLTREARRLDAAIATHALRYSARDLLPQRRLLEPFAHR